MGTWGTGLYSDDTACDVREDYKDLLGDGITEPEATQRLLQRWQSSFVDPEVTCVFWLALSEVQWRLGRLQEQVKKEALAIIENGTDLQRWESDAKLKTKRGQVLTRLREKLKSPQPPEKRVKKRYVEETTWKLGEVYSFRLRSGNKVLLHVIGFHRDKGGRRPICEILDWVGETIPKRGKIIKLGYLFANKPYQHLCQFLFGALGKKDFPEHRVTLVTDRIKPKQKPGGFGVLPWRNVDQQFED